MATPQEASLKLGGGGVPLEKGGGGEGLLMDFEDQTRGLES